MPARAPSRIVIQDLAPAIEGGRYPVKRVVGEPVDATVTAFADGHDPLHVVLAWRRPQGGWQRIPMEATNPGLDLWAATFVPQDIGVHEMRVEAWVDDVHSSDPPRHLARDAARGPVVRVLVERELAACSAWYELFPRSWSTDPTREHGSLADVITHLDDISAAGFDVLYLPPIHPIGTSHRKGPDNSEDAGPRDPGSPWAIGSPDGGHTAVHPELGTLDDVRALAKAARDRGMELALDIAFQCSPDHPWVTEHPEWFRRRADGTIRYAENPPKKYQDIYPFDFACEDWRGLWKALLDVVRFWVEVGVDVFRVDNPHTKPFAFWEWLIAEVRSERPEAVFLSEAFTRPRVMVHLARIGFSQSYGYFPWRVTKQELVQELTAASRPPAVDEIRPSSWPNTPDILPWHLQDAPLTANAARFFLAATLSASYGVYGPVLELGENTPAGNGKEEYGRSEKYELRRWDLSGSASLRPLYAAVNRARHEHQALRTQRTLRFHEVEGDWLLAYSKVPHGGPDVRPEARGSNPILCVANLDPASVRSSVVSLDLPALGLRPDRPFQAHDLLTGETYDWSGADQYVELDPAAAPGHILRISQAAS